VGTILLVVLLALVLSAAVFVYVAYPYRGHQTPLHPVLGDAMRRSVDALPTIDVDERDRQRVA
jgi:hypothetical protein